MYLICCSLAPMCDSCQDIAPVVTVRLKPHEVRHLLEGNLGFTAKQLPILWEYVKSSGWGMANYTKTKLLCGDCVLKWNEESELDRFTRRVFEEQEKD